MRHAAAACRGFRSIRRSLARRAFIFLSVGCWVSTTHDATIDDCEFVCAGERLYRTRALKHISAATGGHEAVQNKRGAKSLGINF